jgi:predicted nicotinamide N-methyase
MNGSYGLYVWPSSLLLASIIWRHRSRFRGKRILELGCGTSLPGIVAALIGAHVILTDCNELPAVLSLVRQQCQRNSFFVAPSDVSVATATSSSSISGIPVRVQGLTWGEFSSSTLALADEKIDLIIGADIFYDDHGTFHPFIA